MFVMSVISPLFSAICLQSLLILQKHLHSFASTIVMLQKWRGWALRRLQLPSDVPWHRVVNAKGQISMSPSREGSDWMQRDLLITEGIPVDQEGRLPLKRFLWRPVAISGASSQ